jgi:hypothetical protein
MFQIRMVDLTVAARRDSVKLAQYDMCAMEGQMKKEAQAALNGCHTWQIIKRPLDRIMIRSRTSAQIPFLEV